MPSRVTSPCRSLYPHRLHLAAALALALLCAAPALAADEPAQPAAPQADADEARAVNPAPVRHLLVKALGDGLTSEEAEKDALRNARDFAVKRLAALGGAAALDPSPQGRRVVSAHRFPVLGFAQARAVALVEFRLRGMDEPPAPELNLPTLTLAMDAATLVVDASRPCEVIVVLAARDAEPEILPGGGGAAYRLAPGKPLRQSLPRAETRLHILACTGGLNPPVNPHTVEAALAKAREGRPHPAVLQGVVSECVEAQAHGVAGVLRSMRQKGAEAPVNMSGAAGREGGLPVVIKDVP